MNEYRSTKRKPNTNIWICPIDNEPVNSRGAAAYLRNKYGISWDHRYLTNPELLCESIVDHFDKKLYSQIISIISNMDFEDQEFKEHVQKKMYRLFEKISDNAHDRDKIDEFLKIISPIIPSGFNFDPEI
jgi:hypothetical protein